jgi:hypothetical protein
MLSYSNMADSHRQHKGGNAPGAFVQSTISALRFDFGAGLRSFSVDHAPSGRARRARLGFGPWQERSVAGGVFTARGRRNING